MKPIKWTYEILQSMITEEVCTPGAFKKLYPSAYKSARQQGFIDLLFIKRKRPKPFTKEQLALVAASCTTRSNFQRKFPSMYNAARKLNLVSELFPISHKWKAMGRAPYSNEELIEQTKKHKTRGAFEKANNGAYQVACRKGIIETYGPAAVQGVSAGEVELLTFLKTLSSDFCTKRFQNDYELDCYSEVLKLGIEYNGLYWHSEINKSKTYHVDKTAYFSEKGIRIIHIWEHEWRDRKEQVMNYLKSACKANTMRIGARKCEFKEIPITEAKKFLAVTHIQGAPNNVHYAVGCFYENILVSVATFGPHHRQSDQEINVLNRFACLSSHTVSGSLAKMSKMAYERLGPLISWADYAKSQAKGYLAAGWSYKELSKPDYFYGDSSGKYISKQSRRKSAVSTPESMTESEHAKLDGLYRIWDCGKILLEYK